MSWPDKDGFALVAAGKKIDLLEGFQINYPKFQSLLAKLTYEDLLVDCYRSQIDAALAHSMTGVVGASSEVPAVVLVSNDSRRFREYQSLVAFVSLRKENEQNLANF